jgi:glutamate decarboxylase
MRLRPRSNLNYTNFISTVLIRNGKSGFRAIMQSITETSDYLAAQLEATGRFTIMNPRQGKSLPLVAFHLKEETHCE